MISMIRKRMRGDKGFTLIELLVVIIIIAILAAIAIPTFLGQRQKAQDSAAKSLVRNAMTAIESAFVDTRDFTKVNEEMLIAIEPSIAWAEGDIGTDSVCKSAKAETSKDAVDVGLIAEGEYEVGTASLSGKIFGVTVNKTADDGENGAAPGNTFYVTNGTESSVGW